MGNRTPFTLVFMAPTAPDYTLASGKQQWSSHLDISSHSLIESSGSSTTELDGESTRLAFGWQYRPSTRWIIRAELPLISHSGGFLDNVIDGFHSLTGLPEGQRNRQTQDRLLFGFDNEDQRVVIDSRQRDVGDAILSAAYRVNTDQNSKGASGWQQNSWIQLGVKLPTGSLEALSGSEASDVAISFHHNRQQINASKPVAVSFDAYMIRVGDLKLISQQEDLHWQLQVKVAKQWTPTLIPEVQLRYRTAAYKNSLAALGSDSLGIDLGVTVLRQRGYWKAGFSEDLDIDSAPDLSLYLQYTHRLGW